MAYMSQENKKEKAPKLRAIFKKYGVKASIGVRHHSTLVVNVRTSGIDFIGNFNENAREGQRIENNTHHSINPYWSGDHYSGKALDFLTEILEVMNDGNFDKSDLMSDYHHVGWYVDINIGQWNKPYVLIEDKTQITKQDLKDLNKGFINPPKMVKVERDDWADFLVAGGAF